MGLDDLAQHLSPYRPLNLTHKKRAHVIHHFIRNCTYAIFFFSEHTRVLKPIIWVYQSLTCNDFVSEEQINRIEFHFRPKLFYQCKMKHWIDVWIHFF